MAFQPAIFRFDGCPACAEAMTGTQPVAFGDAAHTFPIEI
jgi:hypothetical protein